MTQLNEPHSMQTLKLCIGEALAVSDRTTCSAYASNGCIFMPIDYRGTRA